MSPLLENYLLDDPNHSNRNVVEKDTNQNNQNQDDNSSQKCSQCNNDATHDLTISISNTQETETHLLCNPCYQSFIKCQECKSQEIIIAALKNNQKIYVCSECNQKLKDQAKQEKIAQEYKQKLNKILPFIENERYFFTVEKAIKEDKLTLEQLKALKTLLVQVWESDTDENHSIWNKTVYVCPFIDHYLSILDPKIQSLEKPKNYLRKIQAVNSNCCNEKCTKNLADEPVSEPTLTCHSCQTEFTSGFTTHSSSFFCESCAKKNHADGEFKVWVEAVEKENNEPPQQNNRENPSQELKPNPPANQEPNQSQNNQQGKKCTSCQKTQGQEDFWLATDSETKQQLGYYCKVCKDKLEQSEKTKTWEHTNVRNSKEPNNPKQSHPDNLKKWGSDFGQLKPLQREGRMKTQNTWASKKNISFICIHCQEIFPYDKSLENYLEARKKALNELNTHKKSCSLKNSQEAKNKFQNFWNKARKTRQRIIKTCEKCWGKILWDKSISNAETARQQALSDLKYHRGKECGLEVKKKIAIYHSPNSGGNEHAPLDNSLTDDGVYLFDNEGEVYVEQNKTNWGLIAGIGLVGLGIIGGLGFYFWNKRKVKKES